VEQILNKFQAELEKDTVAYLNESRRVAEYDAVLRDSQRSLSALSEHTSQLLAQQTDLENILNGIGAFHTELETNLDLLDSEVDQLFGAQSHLAPVDADLQRENAYATAVQCEQRLQVLSQSLSSTLERVAPKGDGEVADIMKVLHKHQIQLAQLEHVSRSMEQDINQLNVSLNL
jgi:chromosome segregation ATPase